jgi:hypothetical protein
MKPIPHPKPFQSALWPHLPLIRKLRLARKTWPEVAEELDKLGVSINRSTVRRFFERFQKRKELPSGFSEGVEADWRAVQVSVQPMPSDLPLIGPDGKDPLLEEIPLDSPWRPKNNGPL